MSTDSVSSSQPPYQHTSSFPDSQQLPLSQPLPQLPPTSQPLPQLPPTSQPLPQLPPTSLPTNASHTHCRTQPPPNPTVPLLHPLAESPLPSTPTSPIPPSPSLVAQQLHGPTQLPALIPEPKSPGQGPSHSSNPPCSHFIHNEVQFQLPSSPSLERESQLATCCKCHSSGAHCMSCKCSWEERPCVNCYPGRRGKCANIAPSNAVILPASSPQPEALLQSNSSHSLPSEQGPFSQPSMPWTPSPQSQPSLTDEQACNVIRPLSLYTPSMGGLPLMFQCLHTLPISINGSPTPSSEQWSFQSGPLIYHSIAPIAFITTIIGAAVPCLSSLGI